MINKIKSGMVMGVDGLIVDIEVDISKGMPYFSVVGLAGTEVKESKERVRSAILNSGYDFPLSRLVINLSPADIKKDGAYLDLGICVGILGLGLNSQMTTWQNLVFWENYPLMVG